MSAAVLSVLVEQAKTKYILENPKSASLYEKACLYMPGGNTRSVLHVDPFPLTFVKGEGAIATDADGHSYVDLVGNYTAGLYGHSNPTIRSALLSALEAGLSLCSATPYETDLAQAVCDRFPSIEQVRFTNSGTEGNLMALAAAKAFTKREKILVFGHGYHGGVLLFPDEKEPHGITVPHGFVVGRYNDVERTRKLIQENASVLAAVLVEPMLGSGGCLPASHEFLQMLRTETQSVGALLIFDEVMTSRLSPGGLQLTTGIIPDLTTLGKYIGGGMPFGAFGGRKDIMALFDPRSPSYIPHAGTFNNESLSMKGGYVGLTKVYTPEVATKHNEHGDAFRDRLNRVAEGTSMWWTGIGSLMNVHFSPKKCETVQEIFDLKDQSLRSLLYFDMLKAGFHLAKRGFIALSLEVTPEHQERFCEAVKEFLDAHQEFVRLQEA